MRFIQLNTVGASLIIFSPTIWANGGDDFNTDFIIGHYDKTAITEAINKGLNQSAIYSVEINGQSVGSFYFSRQKNNLVFTNEFLNAITPLLKKNLLTQLQQDMFLDGTSTQYKITENTRESILSVWFNDDEILRTDDDNQMPLAESVNALLMNYNASSSYYRDRKTGESQTTLPFSNHVQMGLDDFSVNLDLSSPDALKEGINVDNLSMSHLLPSIKSEVSAGQTYTNSRYGEGFSFLGARMNNVDDLLSRRERLYTPSITGIANSNATVEVYQGSRLIYTKSVAAGKFTIDEVQGLSNQTLRVVVKESNGTEHAFFFENTVVPGLLTPGTQSYQVNAGRYRFGDNNLGDAFSSFEYSYGFAHFTPTISNIISADYQNVTLGAALPLQQLGAIGLAMSNSGFKHNGRQDSGQSYSINYAKYMSNGINIQLAGYRYSTHDYYTFNDAMQAKRQNDQQHDSIRNRFTATLMAQEPIFNNQISVNFLRDQYWVSQSARNTYSLSYGGYARGASYNISLSRSYTDDRRPDTSIALSVDIPFGSSGKSVYTRYNQSNSGNTTQVGLNSYGNGSSYSVAATHDSYAHVNTLSGSYNKYNDRYSSQVNSSVGTNSLYASGSVSGSMALADGHFIASSSQSSTMALVKMDGVEGALINGVRTQKNGYALIPLNDSYDGQDVSVDSSSLENNVMLDRALIKVRPKRGSIVKMDFATKRVKYLRAVLLDTHKVQLGFGSMITDGDGKEYYLGNGGGLLLQLVVKSLNDLKSVKLISKSTGCSYTIPVGVTKAHFQDDFINVGEITCSKI
ncbi:MAG TPA: fimbria/pilus outer membrane usher protein [Scandinavium sp.]